MRFNHFGTLQMELKKKFELAFRKQKTGLLMYIQPNSLVDSDSLFCKIKDYSRQKNISFLFQLRFKKLRSYFLDLENISLFVFEKTMVPVLCKFFNICIII